MQSTHYQEPDTLRPKLIEQADWFLTKVVLGDYNYVIGCLDFWLYRHRSLYRLRRETNTRLVATARILAIVTTAPATVTWEVMLKGGALTMIVCWLIVSVI